MGDTKYNSFIKYYDTIRDVLRDFYIYGCYSRDDFERKNISGRKYDNERRRILNYLRNEFIDDSSYNGNSKYVRLVYDMYKCTWNFLADSYLSKSFNRNDVVLYFLISQILNKCKLPLDTNEIMDNINEVLPEGVKVFDESTVRRKINQMLEEGLLETESRKNKKLYKVSEDFFKDFQDGELQEILNAVTFFMNTSRINVPGFYLSETIRSYMKYERDVVVPSSDAFMFKHSHLQRVIDDDVISCICYCIHSHRKVKFLYGTDKKKKEKQKKEKQKKLVVNPLKIIIEHNYGRQYLFAIDDVDRRPVIFRMDKIRSVETGEIANDEFDYFDYQDQIEKSWCTALVSNQGEYVTVEAEFTFDENTESYILSRLKKEGKWGNIERIDMGKYLYTIEVTDPLELIPWLRSFSGRVVVRHSNKHDLDERLKEDCREALEKYGVI